jgi:hypothetical protein
VSLVVIIAASKVTATNVYNTMDISETIVCVTPDA